MSGKKPVDINKILEQFLNQPNDGATVNDLEQRLELHVTETQAYITSYTRLVMNRNHGRPVMAVHTKTVVETSTVYVYAAENPDDKTARKLRSSETLGPAYFAFGVPLRALKLKLPKGRKYTLPLNVLEVPGQGTAYWTSFADLEHELRNTGSKTAAGSQTEPGKGTDK
ncbi:MAG: hypothetical protein K0R39_2411 [Symbiobacteriaceae bacterium]|jgi:hypothetical protein|nr:hypothetical protein [Symbiobacteriaceae bacterium]